MIIIKRIFEVIILAAIMIAIAGMDFWTYLATGIVP